MTVRNSNSRGIHASGRKRPLAVTFLAVIVLLFGVAASGGEPAPGPHEDYGARAETVIYDVPYVESMPSNPRLMLDVYSNPHEGLWPVVVMIGKYP